MSKSPHHANAVPNGFRCGILTDSGTSVTDDDKPIIHKIKFNMKVKTKGDHENSRFHFEMLEEGFKNEKTNILNQEIHGHNNQLFPNLKFTIEKDDRYDFKGTIEIPLEYQNPKDIFEITKRIFGFHIESHNIHPENAELEF